ncbi:MAG: hypothetical protein E7K04_01255 [Helicobacter sp.]|nr:hypothetical protein [Helicobacter sp.]
MQKMILPLAIVFAGCAKISPPEIAKPNCYHYIDAKITINPPSKNSLYITKGELLQGLKARCIRHSDESSNDLNISYKTALVVSKEDKIATSSENLSARIDARALLRDKKALTTLEASASFDTKTRKILGIGQSVGLSKDDRNALINSISGRLSAQIAKALSVDLHNPSDEGGDNQARSDLEEKGADVKAGEARENGENAENGGKAEKAEAKQGNSGDEAGIPQIEDEPQSSDEPQIHDADESSDLESGTDKEEPNSAIEGDKF